MKGYKEIHGRKDHEKMEAVRQPHAEEHLGVIKGWQRQTKILLCRLQREHGPANTLLSDFWTSEQ